MLTPKTRSNGEKEEERVIDKWGKGRGRSRKKEIGHGWVMWIGAHGGGIGALGCGSISLVLVCYLGGAWMNKALTVAWRGRGRRSDRPDRGFNGAISLSLSLSLSLCVCASVSPSFSPCFSLCTSPEMVWSENNDRKYFPPHCSCFTVNIENIFSLTQFSEPIK